MHHNIPLGIVSAQAAAYLLEQSLLFDGAAYLSRTPSVAGNRKTWTFSCWHKRGRISSYALFSAASDTNNRTSIQFGGTHNLQFVYRVAASNTVQVETTAVFRDPNAWYHIVVVYDSTDATANERVKIYVNGTRVDNSYTAAASLNLDTDINSTDPHELGAISVASNYEDGLMALPILVDGAALDPTSFGKEDDDGYWNPIEFTGTTTQKQPDLTGSSNIGNMTGGGGLAAAFDGTTSQANTAGAALNNSSSDGTVGKDWGIGNTKTINKAVIIGPNNTSIVRNSIDSQGGTTVYLEASTDNFSASTVSLASASTSTDSGEVVVLETSGASAYRYHRIRVQAIDGSSDCFIAEVQFYEDTNSSYGTNGGAYDFADSSWFGKVVNGTYPAIGATWRGSYSSDSDAASYTNSAAALGTADADRYVVVAIPIYQGTSNITISSVTVGGVSATKIHGETFDSGGGNRSLVDYWKVNVPTGTTGDIVITPSGTAPRMSFSWWTCIGDVQIMDKQVHKAVSTGTENVLTVTLQRPDNGFVLAAVTSQGDAGDPTYTWGGTGITEQHETGYGDQDASHGSASGDFTSAERSAVTVTNGLGNQYYYILSAVAFVPAGDNSLVASGFVAADQVSDTPTDDADLGIGNHVTFTPIARFSNVTLSEANRVMSTSSGNIQNCELTIAPESGKFLFEINASTAGNIGMAFCNTSYDRTVLNAQYLWGNSTNAVRMFRENNTNFRTYYNTGSGVNTNIGVTIDNTNDRIVYAIDADNRYLWLGLWDASASAYIWLDGSGGVTGNPEAGTNPTHTLSGTGPIYIAGETSTGQPITLYAEESKWLGSGVTGFKALATQNLPAPTIADPSAYFNTVLWTGDGTSPRKITTGFTPELIWIKNRTDVAGHQLFDIQRDSGTEPYLLASNSTAAETVTGRYLASLASSAFDTDGFNISSDGNVSAKNYVAWCWKAGGTAVTNTDGTITSSVSANPTAGFSIVTWTGTGVAATVGHGLGVPNDFMIFKSRSNVSSPGVVTSALGFTKDLLLEVTDAAYTRAAISNNTAPTSTVFSVGTDTAINVSGYTYVAYCWAEVEGFSKFGSYRGNGSADGPFVFTGFRPAFVLIKRTDSATGWLIWDVARSTYNPMNNFLSPESSAAEGTSSAVDVDGLANGFKIRGTSAGTNASGGTYIFAAYAESPFQGGTADSSSQGRAR